MIRRLWGHWQQHRLIPWRSSQQPPSDPAQLGEAARRLLDDATSVSRILARSERSAGPEP